VEPKFEEAGAYAADTCSCRDASAQNALSKANEAGTGWEVSVWAAAICTVTEVERDHKP
jgi:hypothetical protein